MPREFIYKDGTRFEVTPDGLFYSPEKKSGPAKYDCPDCFFCQWCADLRCIGCRRETGSGDKPHPGDNLNP